MFSFIPDSPLADSGMDAFANAPQVASVTKSLPLNNGELLRPMDKAAFDAMMQLSYDRPVFLMVYASWCPHCKRMFHALNILQERYEGRMTIVTLSIDNNPGQAQAFASSVTPLRLDTTIIAGDADYKAIGDAMREQGLHFEGGRARSVSVPYNAVFYKGEPVAELAGAIPDAQLEGLLEDIVAGAGV